jgi:selenocysteine-specific elongation factor
MHTIGGGTVVSPRAKKRRRGAGDVEGEFRRLEEGSPVDRLLDLLTAAAMKGETPRNLRTALASSDEAFAELLGEARRAGKVFGDARLFGAPALAELETRVRDELEKHHAAHPVLWGQNVGELKAKLSKLADPLLFDLARARMVGAGAIEERSEQLAIAGRPRDLPPDARAAAERIEARLGADGFAPPMTEPLLRELGIERGQDLLARLVLEGGLVVVSPEFVYLAERVDEMAARLRGHFASHPDLSVAQAKDLFDGVSRKHVVPLLEYCDRRAWTRRVGEGRVRGGAL